MQFILLFNKNTTEHILSLHTLISLLIFHIRLLRFVVSFHSVKSKFMVTVPGVFATPCTGFNRNK
jgi:hypothetical protein